MDRFFSSAVPVPFGMVACLLLDVLDVPEKRETHVVCMASRQE